MTRKKKLRLPWQRTFRGIPQRLTQKLQQINNSEVVVGCVKKISAADVEKGHYNHLNLRSTDHAIEFEPSIIPKPEVGTYSRRNVHGYDIVHRNRPKILKPFDVEAPNWNGYGTHTVTFWRDVYERTHIPPKALSLEITRLGLEALDKNAHVFRFLVSQVISTNDDGFEDILLFSLNFLQENTGGADIFPADAEAADYLRNIYQQVGWEVLPIGDREETIQIIISQIRNPSKAVIDTLEQRYDFLTKLEPQALIHGTGGFQRYFGAKFSENLVVFENLAYGNAIYVMYEDWEELSQKSRIELLKKREDNFDRIVHRTGWQQALNRLLRNRLRT